MQNGKTMLGNLMLLITAMIWGAAFVAQSEGMKYIGPFTFNCLRTMLSALTMLIVMPLLKAAAPAVMSDPPPVPGRDQKRDLILGGVLCGVCLCVASSLQQAGLKTSSAGKAGFITALYIVIVPLLGLFLKKKVGIPVWIAVAIATVGMYLLSVAKGNGFGISQGDFLLFLCAVGFSLHILVIDHFSPLTNGVKLSCIQFFTASVLSMAFMLIFEPIDFAAIRQCLLPIAYAGIMSGAGGYTLQILGQRYTDATVASLLMSLESVFAALAGWVLLKEALSPRELTGCVLIFAAILLAQLPVGKWLSRKSSR